VIEGMFKTVFGVDLVTDIKNTIVGNNLFSNADYAEAASVVGTIYNLIQTAALLLMFIYFLIAIVDKVSSEHFTADMALRQFCMFIASFFLINHGMTILIALSDFGMAMLGAISGELENLAVETTELYNNFLEDTKLTGVDIIDNIARLGYLLLPWAFSWLLGMCVKIIIYTRVIEIYIRAAFAPIAFSDFFQHGFQGAGWRHLKNFLAVSIQGAVIYVIAVIFTNLSGVIFQPGADWLEAMGMYFAFLAAAVMLMFRSLSLSREFVGAN